MYVSLGAYTTCLFCRAATFCRAALPLMTVSAGVLEPSLVMAASRSRTKIHAGLASAMASTEMSSPVCESVDPSTSRAGLQAEQVEDRAPGAALARGHVADVAAGDVHRHDGGGAS